MDREPKYLVDVMSRGQKRVYLLLVLLWICAFFGFWFWWFSEVRVVGVFRYVLNTLILAWSVLLPLYFFYFVWKMKRPNPRLEIAENLRVAMVVTKAPSEPFEMVKRTLQAMIMQAYPHDTWLADEDPTDEVLEWCKQKGVKVSTRKGVLEYHRSSWPRRTKCKEGNLAYFYDKHGYEGYDVVVQMDADHVPYMDYLENMIRPFADPSVGYVSAPSICDNNASVSWSARARLYAEASMHGALQAGYNGGWAPLCIGSHYAVRTRALEGIGGLGPELAEDHSTTLIMIGNGWRGVHAFDAEAHGDGPASFVDCMTQEFQWSRSLVVLLMTLTPKYFKKLSFRQRFQFLFSQFWYPLFGLAMATSYSIPVVALLTRRAWVGASYIPFVVVSSILTASTVAVVYWIKCNGWFRPGNAKVISWEVAVFQMVRWPWVLLGSISAVVGVVRGSEFSFRVTPKGSSIESGLPFRVLAPYLLVAMVFLSSALFVRNAGNASGYYYFALVNALFYSFVLLLIVGRHVYEKRKVMVS